MVSAARQAATVAAEDSRIRVLVHDAADVYQPEVIPVRGSLPTLVLTSGLRGVHLQPTWCSTGRW